MTRSRVVLLASPSIQETHIRFFEGGRFTPKELRKSPNLESENSDASSVVEALSLRMNSSMALDTSMTVTQDDSNRTLNNEAAGCEKVSIKVTSGRRPNRLRRMIGKSHDFIEVNLIHGYH